MLDKEQVLQALRGVEDPELHKSVVELNMVRDIQIEGDRVSLEVVLTIQGCPLKAVIEEQVTKALQQIGASEVDVRLGAMTDAQRAQLAERLRAERSGQAVGTAQAQSPQKSALLSEGSSTRFIAITSGKGGVGKSTVTVNLAVALARAGYKVGLIDADIYGFSVPEMMGIEQRPTVIDNLILPVERLGVQVISMGFFVEDNAPVVWRGPMLGKMLRNFFNEIHWDRLDYLLLDLPPGTGDIAMDVHSLLPKCEEIVVTTPHATAAFVAARAGAMARKMKHEILGVVENMSCMRCHQCGHKEFVFGQGGGERLARELDCALLAQIPLGLPEYSEEEQEAASAIYKADSEAGKIFADLALLLTKGLTASKIL